MEDLVKELVDRHKEDKDLTGPEVQKKVKELRKKYNRVDSELGDDEQLVGLDWSGVNLSKFNLKDIKLSTLENNANFENAKLTGTHMEGAGLAGVHMEGADLIDANLEEADLTVAHIEGADLIDANLERANLMGAFLEEVWSMDVNLKGAWLPYAHIERANLEGVHMEGADLMGANLENTNLENADFNYADLHMSKFKGSNIQYAVLPKKDIYEIGKRELKRIIKKLEKRGVNQKTIGRIRNRIAFTFDIKERYEKAADVYRVIKNTFHQNGVYDRESEYHFMERRAYTKHLKRGSIIDKIFWYPLNQLFRFLCGYGEKPLRVIPWVLFVIAFFGTLFWAFQGIKPNVDNWYDYYYFSVITFTTLGFGDFSPVAGGMRIAAMFEAFIGAFLMALFVVVAAKRIMR